MRLAKRFAVAKWGSHAARTAGYRAQAWRVVRSMLRGADPTLAAMIRTFVGV